MNIFIIIKMYCKHRLQIHDLHIVFTVRMRRANGAQEDQACNQNSAARGAMIFLGGAITYNKFSYGQLKYKL